MEDKEETFVPESASAKSMYSLGRRWMSGKREPDDMESVYSQIRSHESYLLPEKVSSLTRWIFENVVVGKLSSGPAEPANEDYARSLWEYLHWNCLCELPFAEGEGKEKMFEGAMRDAIEGAQK